MAIFLLGIYLRHRSPDMNRPIKLPLIILYLFALLCYLLTGLAFINDPYNSSKNILLMLTGLPVHYLLTFLRNKDLQIASMLTYIHARQCQHPVSNLYSCRSFQLWHSEAADGGGNR